MSERPLIELAREAIARAEREMASENLDYAAGVVAGHEAGVASVHHDGVRDYSGALALANARIKELEAQLAAAQTPAAPVVGVVVTEEMCERFANVHWEGEPWISAHPNAREAVRVALRAALTSARTVPLASVEVAMYETATRGTTPMQIPLYRGIAEPAQRGEE